ncbi:Phthiocerol synthesis polyketide synthase type I PpsC [Rosistilla carotiformis]|uniref:Phthiocerol synthesis polyketide synthase type I PpsC n=1 Tax=Rosistilla carotiformis TaxID=2528017 RepID=A0A518JNH0_9BACT|nr:type I polyketide synthase [Rosistilla carotiformis]QDV67061.1 Phthiocerol synthesis polyketide synthase type I PpsC [Rosistilla carotiformis]
MNVDSKAAPHQGEPLAIVGIGCRLPGGAVDAESFWNLLAERRSGIVEVPETRWDRDHYYHPKNDVANRMVTRWGGFVDGIEDFDPFFWGVSPREASRMDPQQRWLLETAWEAIEDSGIAPGKLKGTQTSVFVGVASHDFASIQMSEDVSADVHTNSGCTLSIASNRVSYLLDLKGPSVSVDTACSSALVAVSLACESIWSGKATGALAGGVNSILTPHATMGFSRASMLSPDGQCFAFDARANGYVRGEGAGMVYIKPLRQAIADGDSVYAVIRGAVVNQDGHTSSMTVPGVDGQSAMLRQAYQEAGLAPSRVAYMEAHGTGTSVGDPIELAALGSVLSQGRPVDQPCLLGSVKTNIGHLEAGSGIAGLIKAALVLHKDQVPPNQNFQTPNPNIPFDKLQLQVATDLQPLPHYDSQQPVAAVNSFGFGGTNSHVILEAAPQNVSSAKPRQRLQSQTAIASLTNKPKENGASNGAANGATNGAPDHAAPERAQRPCLLPISARDEVALKSYVASFIDLLDSPEVPLRDVCYSAGARKEQHPDRLVFTGADRETMQQRMRDWLEDPSQASGFVHAKATGEHDKPVFVFTGQGAQWWGMGRELLAREPIFRAMIQRIDALLQPLAGWSLLTEMQRDEADSKINQTAIAQPAIFALQVALVELWKSWGVTPSKVVGHSVGEVAAAYCAGVYSLADAVKVIYHRSRLQDTMAGTGRMLAVGISAAEARQWIGDRYDRVQVAAINSSHLVTLAGDTEPLEEIAEELEKTGKFLRWLRVNYAFHTHQMEPIKEELLQSLADIQPRPAKLPLVSTVTASELSGELLDAHYWWRNVRYPVLFSTAINHMIAAGADSFLEIGPHPALMSSLNQCLADQGKQGTIFHSLSRKTDESEQLLSNVAGLHCSGMAIDWAAVNQTPGHLVKLPRYPWHHTRNWLSPDDMNLLWLQTDVHPLLGRRVIAPEPTWESALDLNVFDYLSDHSFWGSVVFPGAGYCEIGLALARHLFPDEAYVVENVDIKDALFVSAERIPRVRVVFHEKDRSYGVYSSTGRREDWKLHAEGRLTLLSAPQPAAVDLQQLRAALPNQMEHEQYYGEFAEAGYEFGPLFRHIHHVWRDTGEALAEVIVPAGIEQTVDQYHIHPAVLDACFHIFKGVQTLSPEKQAADYFYLPQYIGRVRMYCENPPTRFWAHAQQIADDGKSLQADIFVYDDEGNRIADILGFRADLAEQKKSADAIENGYYQFHWQPAASDDGDAGTSESLEGETESIDAAPIAAAPATTTTPATYLVFIDQQGVGETLCQSLTAEGHQAVAVRAGDEFAKQSAEQFTIRPESVDDMRRIMADTEVRIDDLAGIVHCWSLDHPAADKLQASDLQAAQATGSLHALRLVHLLEGRPFAQPPRVRFVTRGAQSILDSDTCVHLASSPIVGFTRVANNEHPGFRWTVIDLDPAGSTSEHDALRHEVTAGDAELEIAYRNGTRFVNRLSRVPLDDLRKRTRDAFQPDGKAAYRLQTEKPGILTNLSLNETSRRAPGAGEIEVEMKAGGINFRDVMKALGMYPGNPIDLLWFGDDFAGTVTRVGEGVTDLKVGDSVAGMAPYSFRSFSTIDRRLCFKMPEHLSFQEAATLSTVFLTAQYAICGLAHMQAGESILIHAGTGGVGQAAIQIAQHLGLEIFATAGTPEKRQLLRDMGVPHVMDSRSLDFADEVMAITKGRGVDAVLNSLAGDFIPKNFSVLAPFGRFLEIGKIDVYGNSKIGLQALRNNISYFVIDLAQHLEHRPAFIASLFAELSERFEARDFRPLPHTVFPINEVVDAFRYMAQGKHIGKNVLSFEVDQLAIGPCTEDANLFRQEASYLIVGGASGFGLEHAKFMAQHGARHLVLMSRSGARDEAAIADIEKLRASGIEVVDARGDVTSPEDVQRVVDEITATLPPLRGVIHSAMVLDDEFIVELNDERFNKVMNPKLLGAWNLHQATLDAPLEHFVCFSSFSNIVGGAKQSNYNAGNCFLDALAHYRNALGLPALTYNWTALSGAGFVDRNEKTALYLDKIGMKAFSMDEAFRVYRQMLSRNPVQLGACRADWAALARFSPMVATAPTFAEVIGDQSDSGSGSMLGPRIIAASPQEQIALVENLIADQVADVFGIEAKQVDREASLTTLGLDSLMAIDLMNRIETELGVTIAMGSVLGGSSIKDFSKVVLRQLLESANVSESNGTGEAAEVSNNVPLEVLAHREDTFALTAEQFVALQPMDEYSSQHVVSIAKVSSHLDPNAIIQLFDDLRSRHPMLRARFHPRDGRLVQSYGANDGPNCCVTVHDSHVASDIQGRLKECVDHPFDLQSGPCVRVDLFPISRHETILAITAHQAVADSQSLTIVMRELLTHYTLQQQGESLPAAATSVTFEDFAAWQAKWLSGDRAEHTRNYWNTLLKEASWDFALPADHDCNDRAARHATAGFTLPPDLSQQLVTLAAEQDVPQERVLLTAFQILLHRYANRSDIVLELAMHGRRHAELRNVVGPFATSVPVRSQTGDDPTFVELLTRNQTAQMAADEHYPISLALLQQDAGVEPIHNALGVGFSMNEIPGEDAAGLTALGLGVAGVVANVAENSLQSIDFEHAQSANALCLRLQFANGTLIGGWEFDATRYSDETIAGLHELFQQLLEEVVQQPNRRVADFRCLATVPSGSTESPSAPSKASLLSRAGREAIDVDFAKEAMLDPSIVPPTDAKYEFAAPRAVLLTGATGFVGAFVLEQLLLQTDATVYCLVRAKDRERAATRLQDNLRKYDLVLPEFDARVIPVCGDFSKPLLGMSQSQFDELAEVLDGIYHNGADVNLGAPYAQLKNTNVLGTQEVLRLAAQSRLKPVHFVSTFTVMASEATRGETVNENDPLPPPESLLHGYSQSKWVSETMIRQAQARGIPAAIYRPGHVTGHSETGASNIDDLLHTIMLTCWRMGSAPLRSGELDMTPVDYVANAIVGISQQPESLGGVFHLTNPNPLNYRYLVEWMQRDGTGIRPVPYDQWRSELLALTARVPMETMQTLVKTMVPDAADNNGVAPALHPKYDCRITLRMLSQLEIRCAEVDTRLLNLYLECLKRTGAFPSLESDPANSVQ